MYKNLWLLSQKQTAQLVPSGLVLIFLKKNTEHYKHFYQKILLFFKKVFKL